MYDKVYLKSIVAVIKMLQILVLLIAFATVLSFDLEVIYTDTSYSMLRFFELVAAVAWCTCVMVFALNVSRITRNLPVPWHWVNLILGMIFALFLLLASGFITSTVDKMKKDLRTYTTDSKQIEKTGCEYLLLKDSNTSCRVLELGAVCGFITVLLFGAEVVINALRIRRGDYTHDTPVAQPPVDNVTVSSVVQHN